jgi:hypothetical protein
MPTGPAKSWQTDEFKVLKSAVTGRTLYINKSDRQFLIPPTFVAERAREAALAFDQYWKSIATSGNTKPTSRLRPFLSKFNTVVDRDEFCHAIDLLIKEGTAIRGVVNRGRISDLLIALWRADCLALPREANALLGQLRGDREFWGPEPDGPKPSYILREFVAVSTAMNKREQVRKLCSLMFSITGVRECGDLTPEVMDRRFVGFKLAPSITSTLVSMMREHYGASAISFTFDAYGPFGRKAPLSDDTFTWVLEQSPDLEEWRSLSEDWMGVQVRDISGTRAALNAFLRYMAQNRGLPRRPADFFRSGQSLHPPMSEEVFSRRDLTKLTQFINWILDTSFVGEDDHGHPYRLPGFRNPVTTKPSSGSGYGETVRDAMPTRFIRRLREIIEENDYAWPKQAFEKGTDTFRWRDPETGQWHDIWSPVRAYTILMKLELPERTFQVRVCNSGEADRERYDFATDTWSPNAHALAGQSPYDQDMGLARKIRDLRANKTFTGLYFNTNKTGDIGKSPADRGHTIPWQNHRVLQLYDDLRRWQEKFNPIHRTTAWTDLQEEPIKGRYSEDILRERGSETFLFRDPCSAYPDQPVTHSRLTVFWNKLCEELERRLAEEGETTPGGGPIQLVTRRADGRSSGTIYNLHSLRVTMISAWAETGVPIDILMKVAGHATAIMTIYYQKQSASHITELLNNASAQMMLNEQGNWQAWLKSKSYDSLQSLVAFNDVSGPHAFSESSSAAIVRRDHGLCPVGCSLCHEGGPKMEGVPHRAKHHPVPGGPQNCVRCRFFITGPCFLLGLNAYFDDIGFRYRLASRKYMETSNDFDRLDHQRRRALAAGEPFKYHSRLEALSSTLDQRTREVDEVALTWHATYNLIQQCTAILRNPDLKGDNTKLALITVGGDADLEYILELDEHGDREFELHDKLCHYSVFFKSLDPTVPNLKRMRRFDALLMRSGYEAAFVELSEEEALAAGNEFTRFLFTQYGRDETNKLVNGQRTLRGLGLDAEKHVVEHFSTITGRRLARSGQRKLLEAGEVL